MNIDQIDIAIKVKKKNRLERGKEVGKKERKRGKEQDGE